MVTLIKPSLKYMVKNNTQTLNVATNCSLTLRHKYKLSLLKKKKQFKEINLN